MNDLQRARQRWLTAQLLVQKAQTRYVLEIRRAELYMLRRAKLKRLAGGPALLRQQGD